MKFAESGIDSSGLGGYMRMPLQASLECRATTVGALETGVPSFCRDVDASA